MFSAPRDQTNSRINHTKFALQAVATVASAADFIPGLKAAAELAITIVDVAYKVRNNRQDCIMVADRSAQLVMAVVETTRGLTAADIDPCLKADLERFSSDLEEIREVMVDQANRGTLTRILNHAEDVGSISRCKEILDHSFKTFQVYSIIAMRLQITRLEGNTLNRPSYPEITNSPCSHSPVPARTLLLIHDKSNSHLSLDILSPHPVIYNTKRYPTSFHLYQSLKFAADHDVAEQIRTCSEDPLRAHQVAQQHVSAIRPDWDQIRVEMMDQILWYKFVQFPSLLQDLLATGDAEIINNTEHPFWGVGPTGSGSNEWGKALERLRKRFWGFRVQHSDPSTTTRSRVYIFDSTNPRPSFDMLSPHPVVYNGQRFPTGFHLYQSLKFPPEIAEQIRTCSEDPSMADQLQRHHLSAVRADWDQVCVLAWDQAQWCKFTQHSSLLEELFATGDAEIIHDSTHAFWGIGPTGGGQNEAGKALERLRHSFW